jgi:fructose-1,6-bisphosphatase I
VQLDETFMNFLLNHQRKNKRTLNFLILMESLMTAARKIDYLYRSGALRRTLGEAGATNVQGESVMKMDLLAHQVVLHYLSESKQVMEVTSEEVTEEIRLNDDGRYIVYYDPIDGSSNVRHSLPVGFLFGIVKRDLDKDETYRLRTGREFIAAGMFLIPSGLFTFALRNAGTWRFLMDETGVYVRPTRITLPANPKNWELSWNVSNTRTFQRPVQRWLVEHGNKYNFRYAGSLVVDFHRMLHSGGMFLYPSIVNHENPEKNRPEGKLRLLYEAAVVSFIAHEAGGFAVDEHGQDLLDVAPFKRHQRSALYVGNREIVSDIQKVLLGAGKKKSAK